MIERTIFLRDREGKNLVLEVFLKGNDKEAFERIAKIIHSEFEYHDLIDSEKS